jgi:uncharacterized protein (TIGR02145 family)
MGIGMEFLVKEWKGSDANRQGVCPAGWHLPSKEEWQTLINAGGDSLLAGKKLKSKTGWNPPSGQSKCKYTYDGKQYDYCGTDEFGFSALPGGRFAGGFTGVGWDGYWWSTSENGGYVFHAWINSSFNKVSFNNDTKTKMFNVRCVQNNADSKADAEVKTAAKMEAAKKASGGKNFTDPRDKKTYKSIKIGTQTWMAENLSYNAEGSVCYKRGDNPDEAANCAKYGRLYNWETAKKACPDGWHLPSNDDWDKLLRFADFTRGYGIYESQWAGNRLKAKSGWKESYATDDYGFSALPGGYCSSSVYNGRNIISFADLGFHSYWWSADEKDSDKAHYRRINYHMSGAYHYDDIKSNLLSVRCVKD